MDRIVKIKTIMRMIEDTLDGEFVYWASGDLHKEALKLITHAYKLICLARAIETDMNLKIGSED